MTVRAFLPGWFFTLMIVLLFITAVLVVVGKYRLGAPDSVVYPVGLLIAVISGYLIYERRQDPLAGVTIGGRKK
jgi:energy-coupling factor transporter transmembrane protein EcfT